MPAIDSEWMSIIMEDVGIVGPDEAQSIQEKSLAFNFGPQRKDAEDSAAEPSQISLSRQSDSVDVEKQCAVRRANGKQCKGSLACKRHSMSAKRAVPGRSMPFDSLLADYEAKRAEEQASRGILPPTMVVRGEHDIAMAKRDFEILVDRAKACSKEGSRGLVMEGAWHNHSINIPEAFAKAIHEWHVDVFGHDAS